MKFRAFFAVTDQVPDSGSYFSAENRDKARLKIIDQVTKIYNSEAKDIEFYNLLSEFEDPAAVNDKVVGWQSGKPIEWDKDYLVLD